MEKQLIIDGNRIHDIPSFYEEINRLFMTGEDWQIGNSLDALNDILYGGFGPVRSSEPLHLIWKNMEKSRAVLGVGATRQYYEQKLQAGPQFNQAYFKNKLEALNRGEGQTYFDIILEIIAEHPHIRLEAME